MELDTMEPAVSRTAQTHNKGPHIDSPCFRDTRVRGGADNGAPHARMEGSQVKQGLSEPIQDQLRRCRVAYLPVAWWAPTFVLLVAWQIIIFIHI